MLNRKKCVVISQPKCRGHNCAAINLVCFVFCLSPQVGYSGFLQTRVFLPYKKQSSVILFLAHATPMKDPHCLPVTQKSRNGERRGNRFLIRIKGVIFMKPLHSLRRDKYNFHPREENPSILGFYFILQDTTRFPK
jgi:hypothetical protein